MRRASILATGRVAVAASLFVMTSATLVAAQDFTIQLSNGDGKTKTHFVSPKAVRTVSSYPIETDVIYRLDQRKIITLDHKSKTYREETLAEARERARKTHEEIIPPTATKIGPAETILGYATEKYALKADVVQTEMWVAPALAFPPAFREAAAAAMPRGLMAVAETAKNVHGIALKTVSRLPSKLTMPRTQGVTWTEVATAVDTNPIPPSTFEPPPGYRRVQR